MSKASTHDRHPIVFNLEAIFNLAQRATMEQLQDRLVWLSDLDRRRHSMSEKQINNLSHWIKIVRHWLTVRSLAKALEQLGKPVKVAPGTWPEQFAHLN